MRGASGQVSLYGEINPLNINDLYFGQVAHVLMCLAYADVIIKKKMTLFGDLVFTKCIFRKALKSGIKNEDRITGTFFEFKGKWCNSE